MIPNSQVKERKFLPRRPIVIQVTSQPRSSVSPQAKELMRIPQPLALSEKISHQAQAGGSGKQESSVIRGGGSGFKKGGSNAGFIYQSPTPFIMRNPYASFSRDSKSKYFSVEGDLKKRFWKERCMFLSSKRKQMFSRNFKGEFESKRRLVKIVRRKFGEKGFRLINPGAFRFFKEKSSFVYSKLLWFKPNIKNGRHLLFNVKKLKCEPIYKCEGCSRSFRVASALGGHLSRCQRKREHIRAIMRRRRGSSLRFTRSRLRSTTNFYNLFNLKSPGLLMRKVSRIKNIVVVQKKTAPIKVAPKVSLKLKEKKNVILKLNKKRKLIRKRKSRRSPRKVSKLNCWKLRSGRQILKNVVMNARLRVGGFRKGVGKDRR